MINRVVLVGRLTKDPELRQTQTGISVATFTLATNRTFANQSGEREADYVPCVIWRKQAENVAQYVGKGSLVGVEGRLQTRSYDAADGTKRFVMEVVADSVQFLESRNARSGGAGQVAANNNYNNNPGQANQNAPADVAFSFENDNSFDISDDDLPF
ncbi:MAG: single-stranded DNA-binding protein [Culicoidibacterales bacterium]